MFLKKNENTILLMLAFFSISVGLWGNFRQLWLQANSFTVTNISNINKLNLDLDDLWNDDSIEDNYTYDEFDR